MKITKIFYATNRNHVGTDRWHPASYGTKFSDDGTENLRFGKVTLAADEVQIKKYLSQKKGDGEALSDYLAKLVKQGKLKIEAYREQLDKTVADVNQKNAVFGSQAMFAELKSEMMKHSDVLIYIHGFNVSWDSAVGSAMALQEMLNRPGIGDPKQKALVVLFTWPSDGAALPFVSYKSDRTEAKGSGYAFARGVLKFRDYLVKLQDEIKKSGGQLCGQDVHLLCHSMGNYVLQNTIERIDDFTPGSAMPRLFEHIFLCAPDVDDDVLEPSKPLGRLHELARCVNVYHNRGDIALRGSDYTKGNPERLGSAGAARPNMVHNKVHQIDCTPVVKGFMEHSYYLWGPVNTDLRLSIDGKHFEFNGRKRAKIGNAENLWTMQST